MTGILLEVIYLKHVQMMIERRIGARCRLIQKSRHRREGTLPAMEAVRQASPLRRAAAPPPSEEGPHLCLMALAYRLVSLALCSWIRSLTRCSMRTTTSGMALAPRIAREEEKQVALGVSPFDRRKPDLNSALQPWSLRWHPPFPAFLVLGQSMD